MIKNILWILFFGQSCICQEQLVNRIFDPKFKANFQLFIPTTIHDSLVTLVIKKENFKKYLSRLDTAFNDNDFLKNYTKNVVFCSKKFEFSEFAYTEILGMKEYKIISKQDFYYLKTHDDKLDFLKKHLINYNEKETYFNLNTNFQPVDYYRILGTLFKMNYLTYEADGYIGVIRVGCSEE